MNEKGKNGNVIHNNKPFWVILFCIAAVCLNVICNQIVGLFNLPLYLDTVGTIITAALGGAVPGVFVALCTNLILGFGNGESVYFGILNILIAVATSFWWQSEKKGKLWSKAFLVLLLSGIGGGLGFILTWNFSGFSMEGSDGALIRFFYETCKMGELPAMLTATIIWDFIDKLISVAIGLCVVHFLPQAVQLRFPFTGWRQTPLSDKKLRKIQGAKPRVMSLGTKIIMLLIVAFVFIAVVATGIGRLLFDEYTKQQYMDLTESVAQIAAGFVDPEKVEEYIEKGEAADGYLETKQILERLRDTTPGVKFVYVYQIREDGCHVVFDLDSEEWLGAAPGEVIAFDESFESYIPALLKGEKIEPLVSDDTYGWLLTSYQPVYDQNGNCVCYACADMEMQNVEHYGIVFVIKMGSLFLGFFALLLAVGLWIANYHLIYPINAMAYSASAFAYDSEEAQEKNVDRIQELRIRTGDELERLYEAFVKTTQDSQSYFAQMQQHSEMLSRFQSGLIMVLADMVENRDESTGAHVRKTAAYTKIIMDKMRELGYQTDVLTDGYVRSVVRAAPLHDIGKIHVPDFILNKPGKLTEEEFERMKEHTTAGRRIIEQAMESMPDSDYLQEAVNVTAYHHEKWNGKGYPKGLAGEDIPLSARIMAVADVFDALVSKRCYKDPFPFENAMEIILKDSGTHFDPQVVEAFSLSKDRVKEVSEMFDGADAAAIGKDFFYMIM